MALATHNGGHHDTEWPSLAASHGMPTTTNPVAAASSGEGDDWELLSTDQNTSFEVEAGTAESNGEGVVLVSSHPQLMRQRSHSFPDARELEDMAIAAEEAEEDEAFFGSSRGEEGDSSVVVVPPAAGGPETESVSGSVVMVNKPKVSFRDAMLASSSPAKPRHHHNHNKPHTHHAPPKVRNKVKTRYVVTPIKRCAKSTGDLLSLVHDDEDEGGESYGHSDAMEFYNRKAHGAKGHSSGQKLRPDEAKRKVMIMQKKDAQRKNQG